MFQKVRDRLYWKGDFDTSWSACQKQAFDGVFHLDFFGKRAEKSRIYWRTQGQKFGYSPQEAVFEALLDLAKEAHEADAKGTISRTKWHEIVSALFYACPWCDSQGRKIDRRERIPARWHIHIDEIEKELTET